MSIQILREDERGQIYQCEGFKVFYRIKNSISGDNDINPEEKIYLITGSAEITQGTKTWTASAPAYIEIPANTYHKITALTNISFIILDNRSE